MRLDSTADLSRTKDWVNQIYSEVCIETEAIQAVATMTLTSGTSTYTMDTSIIRVKQMYVTPSGQARSRPLQPTSIEQILEWSASNGATVTNMGYVTHYAMFGIQDILFYPTPTAADVVTIYYVKQPTALSAVGDIPVIQEPYASNCLVEGACFQAALFLKDPDAQLYSQSFERAKQSLRAHLRRREGSMTRQFRITRGVPTVPHDPSVDTRQYA